MAVPKVIYLIDFLHAALPLIHKVDYNDKCVSDHETDEGLCGKATIGGIFWTCNDDGTMPDGTTGLCCGYFYCKKHLDMRIRKWFKDSKVTVVQPDGKDIEKEIEKLLGETEEK